MDLGPESVKQRRMRDEPGSVEQQVRLDALVDPRRAVGAILDVLVDEVARVPVARFPEELDLGGDHVLAAEVPAAAADVVVEFRRWQAVLLVPSGRIGFE